MSAVSRDTGGMDDTISHLLNLTKLLPLAIGKKAQIGLILEINLSGFDKAMIFL